MSKTGIIGAMESEVKTLKAQMEIKNTIVTASMEFCEGTLHGRDVVVVQSGIGKVNAGICAQLLADRFQADHVINTGVAGSLDAEINIGDIVVSTDCVYHDMDATIFGYKPGEVPQMGRLDFPADSALTALAADTCRQVNPEIGVFTGRIASGDQFISSRERKDEIVKEFHALCVEMEGAAIAHTCFLNHIPFVIIRAISDKADDSATEDYPAFEKKAAAHCARLVMEIIKNI